MMMIKKRIEQTPLMIPTIQVLLERVELPGPLSRRASRHLRSKIDRPPGAGWCRVRVVGRMFSKRKETPSPPLVCRPVIAFERDYYSLNILIVPRDWRKDGEKLAGQIAE